MKKLILTTVFLVILASGVTFSACSAMPGANQMTGADARALIHEATDQVIILYLIDISAYSMDPFASQTFVALKVITDMFTQLLLSIDDGDVYKKDSVYECVNYIKTIGIAINLGPLNSILCNLEKANTF